MKIIKTLLVGSMLILWSTNSLAFQCKSGSTIIKEEGGTATVIVDLKPQMNPNENLVIDLTSQISCSNTREPEKDPDWHDLVSLYNGSMYKGALENFKGRVIFNNNPYPFPVVNESGQLTIKPSGKPPTFNTPMPLILYLTPTSAAGGKVIKAGDLFAELVLHQVNTVTTDSSFYTWKIISNNDVTIPTGGCDVSSRDKVIDLPDYPGEAAIPLTVHCAKQQSIGYYLSGTTVDSDHSIFSNIASTSAAQGIGVQMKRNGVVVPTGSNVSLGTVGLSPVDLGLTATYARTKGQVTAGKVQSIIGVTFVYQ
ncbi:fimbrial protein [Klebsiella sp. A-Nf5]|uniref:fimbrial protein n=1 Tax=unclassified Klebsiella TaxID=2608929 RepID=UPI000C2AE401|nr:MULTISPECIES: fimbrial protein [unclassified Klebsiella]PJX33386.1 fimbrial protein [Klebsiella sp. A-Nf5]PJX35859.1 fimbrial protein [Klebsiella sp. B-Nf7]PJX46414.1 fimbrial protein [Klebsiella sp. C1-16S-Nf17]